MTSIQIRLKFQVSVKSCSISCNLLLIHSSGGGKDLENAAVVALEENIATTSKQAAAKQVPQINITSSYLKTPIPIKISIPQNVVTSTSTLSKPIIVKNIGNVTTPDGKQIKFIPPKVNTANNRVPPEERFQSTGSGERNRELKKLV